MPLARCHPFLVLGIPQARRYSVSDLSQLIFILEKKVSKQ